MIDKSDPKNPVYREVVTMTADEEDNYHVAQANESLMKKVISFITQFQVVTEKKLRITIRALLITWMFLRRWYSQLLQQ